MLADMHGQEQLALGLLDAAHGELAQAGAFLEVGEAALGDGGPVGVEVPRPGG